MACTEQKKKLLKKKGKHGIRAKKYTRLLDRLPKMRITNDIKTLGPAYGKNIDKDALIINLPPRKVSKLPDTVTQVTGAGEVLRSACALTCRTTELEHDGLEGARVYSIAQERHASFYFSGTDISRLLTHGIRAKKYTRLLDRLPKMHITNDIKTLGPVCGKNIDKDARIINLPPRKVSKLPDTVTQVTGAGEVLRSACALTCRTTELEHDGLEGARVYSIAQERHASFYFSGTDISRLLTHGIRAKKYTRLLDRLPKMHITNDIKTLGPVCGKNIDKDARIINLPPRKVSKLPDTVTQVTGAGEVLRSACALTCRTTELEHDGLEGARVYSIAQERQASFYFSGTDISRLLTFVQTVDADMQTILKKINPGLSTIRENDPSGGISFTLAINLHNVREYFDMHDIMCCTTRRSSLKKVDDVTEIATLPVNTTSSMFTISIERQSMVVQIVCFKLNAICEQFWNTLATMSGKLVATSMARNAPSLLLHKWYLHDITQGYFLKHLLNSTNIVTLNTMRKLYFVIITSPYPHFNLNINLRCSKNGIFTTLDPKPVSDFSKEKINWSKLHEAVWISSMKEKLLVDESRYTSQVNTRSAKSDTLANRSPRLEVADLKKVYIYSSSKSINTESNKLITEKRSVATMCDLPYDKPSLETVPSWKSINDSIFKIKSIPGDMTTGSLNFLRSKLGFAIPKLWVESDKFCFRRFYYGYINENLIFDAQALKDQYLNQIEPKELCRVFLKSFG